jgi:hypothetical protein
MDAVEIKGQRLVKLRYFPEAPTTDLVLTTTSETLGAEKNGTASGVMDPKSGPPNGCNF